jgi:NAD(P)-dependent dehydrogenase (short-subunit alcohol dehydrogenase family)
VAGRLAGKVAIVAGAGSRGPGLGNGKAAAILFAREGAAVLCVDAQLARAEETVGIIKGEGGAATAFAADVTRAADCRAMVAAAVERHGGLDVLHNNVGIESRKNVLETSEEDWDRVMAVDLKSMLLATQAAIPVMAARGGGSIICVSSVAAMRGHGRTAYAAAKAGVIGFMRSVAAQVGRQGIRVNAIAPGMFPSEMTTQLVESDELRTAFEASVPLKRLGREGELDGVLAFLASDASSYVTGQTFVVDGGITLA